MERSKKYLGVCLVVLLIVGLSLNSWAASASGSASKPNKEKWPDSLLIEGMSVGTSAYMVAAAIARAIKDDLGIRTQVTAGVPPVVATGKVGRGDSDITFSVAETPYDAFKGLYRWKGKQVKDLRVLSHVVFVAFHFVTWPDKGINSVADLKGKRVMGDQAGTRFVKDFSKAVLAANGLTTDDVKIISWKEWGEQISFIRMKLGDAIFLECGVGTAPVMEVDRTLDLKFVPFSEKEIEAVLEKGPFFLPFTIPAGSYTHQPQAYPTVGCSVSLVINARIPDSLVYEICKILFDKPGRFQSVHASWGKFDINSATLPRTAPFHAGAVKYYKEKGIWNTNVDDWQKNLLKETGLVK